MKKNKLIYAAILSALMLTGCGSTSSDGTPPAKPLEKALLKGTATDAIITNGTLRVYALDDGIQGALIAQTTTDGKGDFSIDDFASKDRPIMIEISGGRYTEEASGVSVELLPGQVLRAYLFYRQGSDLDIQLTPLTHLSSCLADFKVSAGININNAITEATSVFSGMIGVDILGTKPLDITDPANANFELTDSLRYGTVLAAISSYTAEISVENGVTPHRFNQNSSIYATQVLCQDIASDGVFNGQGFINNTNSVGQLALGSVAIDVDFLRTRVAQNILSIMTSDRNVTNLPVSDFVLYANGIAGSTDAVFGGVATTPVDQTGPVVTAVLAPDSFLKGVVDLRFNVADPIGVETVSFLVNDAPHSVGQALLPKMSLNTTNFTDGQVKITVVATDILNNETRIDFNYTVDNSSPIVALTSSVLVNNKNYTATGSYEEEGASVASITVNGVEASINSENKTWTANLSLLSGENVLTMEVTDSANNVGVYEAQVDVDLIKPVLTAFPAQVTYTTFQGQLNLCTGGQLSPTSGGINPLCLSTDRVSLNGIALDGGLQNQDYILLEFSPSDPQGAGVFTDQKDLIIEYQYSVNGSEVISWSPAPKSVSGSDLFYYFPMVTEYLGETWYQTTTNDIHQVIFRATDKAGNSSKLTYEMKFDVLIPEITATSSVSNKELFSNANFSTRSSVDGQLVKVEYSIDNPSNTAYYISLNDAENHTVGHVVESMKRKNRARIKEEYVWRVKFADQTSKQCVISSGLAQCLASPLYSEEWTLVDSLKFADGSGGINKPSIAYSPELDYLTDVVTVASTGFRDVAMSECKGKSLSGNGYFEYSLTNDDGSLFACSKYIDSFTVVGQTIHFQEAINKTVEYSQGYPRNESTNIITNLNMMTENISVLNDSIGQEIMPVRGWYRVPPKTTIKIVKSVRTPIIYHETNLEVAQADFSSYVAKKLDKSTTWKIDTDLEITRAIDAGSVDKLSSVTSFTETIGDGIKAFTIAR